MTKRNIFILTENITIAVVSLILGYISFLEVQKSTAVEFNNYKILTMREATDKYGKVVITAVIQDVESKRIIDGTFSLSLFYNKKQNDMITLGYPKDYFNPNMLPWLSLAVLGIIFLTCVYYIWNTIRIIRRDE